MGFLNLFKKICRCSIWVNLVHKNKIFPNIYLIYIKNFTLLKEFFSMCQSILTIHKFIFNNSAPFLLNIFKFLSSPFWWCRKTAWWESSKVNLKIYDFINNRESTVIIAMYILRNISRSQSNQRMFFQLIKCNVRYIFLQKSYRKNDRKIIYKSLFIL